MKIWTKLRAHPGHHHLDVRIRLLWLLTKPSPQPGVCHSGWMWMKIASSSIMPWRSDRKVTLISLLLWRFQASRSQHNWHCIQSSSSQGFMKKWFLTFADIFICATSKTKGEKEGWEWMLNLSKCYPAQHVDGIIDSSTLGKPLFHPHSWVIL